MKLEAVQNFRTGKMNLNYSSNDVVWHPLAQFEDRIATAATNGAVVVWNALQAKSKAKKLTVIKDHKRTVNRVAWHPTHGYTLLSGSQDGGMKLWDTRDPTNNVLTFDGHADAVRDVQFSPFYSNYFGAAFDSGSLQIWDIRRTAKYERKLTAHNGPCLAIDWHPMQRDVIASGGRDLALRVWNLNNASRATDVIDSPSSVARLRWRPSESPTRSHIAVGASVMDKTAQLWNLASPRIPHRTVLGHNDIVTGLLWHRKRDAFLWTCSKDGVLRCHDIRRSYRPIEHMNTVALSWSPVGHQLAVVSDHVDRRPAALRFGVASSLVRDERGAIDWSAMPLDAGITPPATIDNGPMPPDNAATAVVLLPNQAPAFGRGLVSSQGVAHVLSPSGHPRYASAGAGLSSELFCFLARNYRFSGEQRPRSADETHLPASASVAQLCAHNSKVAISAGQGPLARFWSVVAALVACETLLRRECETSSSQSTLQNSDSKDAHRLNLMSSVGSEDSSLNSSSAQTLKSGAHAADKDYDGEDDVDDDALFEALDRSSPHFHVFDTAGENGIGVEEDEAHEEQARDVQVRNIDDLGSNRRKRARRKKRAVAQNDATNAQAMDEDEDQVIGNQHQQKEIEKDVDDDGEDALRDEEERDQEDDEEDDDDEDEDDDDDDEDDDDDDALMLLRDALDDDFSRQLEAEATEIQFNFANSMRPLGWGAQSAVDGNVWSRNHTTARGSAIGLLADDLDVGIPLPDEEDAPTSAPDRSMAVDLFPAAAAAAAQNEQASGLNKKQLLSSNNGADGGEADEGQNDVNSNSARVRLLAVSAACEPTREPQPPVFGGAKALADALEWYVNQGDVQTAAMVVLVCGDVELCGIDERRRLQWFSAYLELLQRNKLWSESMELVTLCGVRQLENINVEQTTVPTACPQCGRALYEGAHRCEKCLIMTSTCCLCRRVVRGLYVWCQGCGHGGHAKHMRQWFVESKQTSCPTGCGHECDFSAMRPS